MGSLGPHHAYLETVGVGAVSAYVVSKEHIDALVDAAVSTRRDGAVRWYHPKPNPSAGIQAWSDASHEARYEEAEAIGEMLISANLASVFHRYPDLLEDSSSVPGPVAQYWREPYHLASIRPSLGLTPVAVLKALDGYEYQACEHPEWEESEAHAFCEALRRHTIGRLPGYADAAWEITGVPR